MPYSEGVVKMFSRDVAVLLEDSAFGQGLVLGNNLFIGNMPSTPDFCVSLYDIGGTPAVSALDRSYSTEPEVSVQIRTHSYPIGHEMGENIRKYFNKMVNVQLQDGSYVVIMCIGGVEYMKADEKGRSLFIMKLRAIFSEEE
jgi:hypothetical protein